VAETYQVIQLGLSIVTFKNKLKVYPYNFYLFPRNPVASDKNISMQLKCVNFNSDNGIDWNKWIKEGINYIRLSEKESIERS
jgi:poly(A)-specific ribonuclease